MRPRSARVALAYLERADDSVAVNLSSLLALLRAQYVNYQHAHWQAEGHAFYADHLLFQRLYDSVQKQIDELAEKIVGYAGTRALNAPHQMAQMGSWVTRWSSASNPHARGLLSEKDCQQALRATYDTMKGAGVLPLGLDDWIMATASQHETNIYLLQQVLAGRT